MFISPSFTRMAQAGWKANLLTTSAMLVHAIPSIFVSSLREFPGKKLHWLGTGISKEMVGWIRF